MFLACNPLAEGGLFLSRAPQRGGLRTLDGYRQKTLIYAQGGAMTHWA